MGATIDASITPSYSLTRQVGAEAGISGGGNGSGGSGGGQGGGQIDANAGVNGSLADTTAVQGTLGGSGSIQGTLKPGTITTVTIAEKDLKTRYASTKVDNIHASVSACAGPVTIRLGARLTVTTDIADNTLYTYSDPHWL